MAINNLFGMKVSSQPDSNRDPKTPVPLRRADRTRPRDNGVFQCDSNWALAQKHLDACRKSIHSKPDRNLLTPPLTVTIWSLGFSSASLYASHVEHHPHSMSPDRSIFRFSFFSLYVAPRIWRKGDEYEKKNMKKIPLKRNL